jgi:hypothetical protein
LFTHFPFSYCTKIIIIVDYIEAEDWQEYVSKTLRETRDRDRAALGGTRPSNHDSMSPSREESEDEEEDDDTIEAVDGGDMASDQVCIFYNLFSLIFKNCY